MKSIACASGPILVTGATGFIGEQLVRRLVALDQRVRIFVRRPDKARELFGPLLDQLEVAAGDLRDPKSIADAVRGVDSVYHSAARVTFQGNWDRFWAVNLKGTQELLDACRQAGVRRVLHLSSVAAGGPAVCGHDGRYHPRTEADLPAPLDCPYGRSKLAQEEIARSYNSPELQVVIVRPSAVFGRGDRGGVNLLLDLIRRRRLPFYLGSKKLYTNIVWIDDVIRGTISAMERGRPGEVYNLVGPPLTQEELFKLVAEISGGSAPRLSMPAPLLLGIARLVALAARAAGRRYSPVHPNDVRNWTACWLIDGTKAKQELGIEPADMRMALKETLEWIESEEAGVFA